jgi:co-chaperonin GroES (HSP10)
MANMLATAAVMVAHDEDPKAKLLRAVGDKADNIRPLWTQVLIGVYSRGGYDGKEVTTKGGIILTQKATEEDLWQGKIGMLLAVGPGAFRDSNNEPFPDAPKIGDWVHFRVGDSLGSLSGKLMLRFMEDTSIRAVIDDPDSLY